MADRLEVFGADGSFITKMTGDATLSKWGEGKLAAYPQLLKEREGGVRCYLPQPHRQR